MEAQIQVRRSTAAQWISANPILVAGEPGLETDTGKGKYGDGTTHWTALQYSWQHLGGGPTGPAGGSLAGTYPNPTLATNVVGAPQIIDGGVGNAELAANAVTTAKVADGAITGPKLADGAVTGAKLAPGGIGSAQIADGSIAVADLAPATVQALMVDVYDEGAPVLTDVGRLNFVGEGVGVSTASGVVTVSITGAPASAIIPGTIAEWYDPAPPAGWYLCDGSVHTDLSGTLGTRYGASPGTVPYFAPIPIDGATNVVSDVVTSVQPGWQVNSVYARRILGMCSVLVQYTRSGATIPLGNPQHSDQTLCVFKPLWIPDISVGGTSPSVVRMSGLYNTGTVHLSAGIANGSYTDSDVDKNDVFSFYYVYPVAAAAAIPKTYKIIKGTAAA